MPFKNREKAKLYHKEYNKKWYAGNIVRRRKEIAGYMAEHIKTGKYRYSMYKSSAKKRGILFMLDKKNFELFIRMPCVYCGEIALGIDRVNNEFGYLKENIMPCCSMCNYMKKNYPVEQFIRQCKKIAEFCANTETIEGAEAFYKNTNI